MRCLVGKGEFLTQGQPNHARQRELLLGKIVAGQDKLLLPALELYLSSEHVDRRDDPRLLLIDGAIV